MASEIFWIRDFDRARLGTMARPRGDEWLPDEVASWKQAGAAVIASALTDEEMSELGISKESELCEAQGIHFVRFPVPDRGLPHSLKEWTTFIDGLCASISDQKTVVAHCRMGIGRSSMIAISVMVSLGIGMEEALTAMIAARRRPIPDTAEQLEWLARFADSRGKAI